MVDRYLFQHVDLPAEGLFLIPSSLFARLLVDLLANCAEITIFLRGVLCGNWGA